MPGVVRALKPSPDAKVMSVMAERDLHEPLQDQVGSGLLAVVTVARGGLTGRDLAELTGVRPHDIDMRLHRITGRGLLPEKSGYTAAPDADIRRYILGHDELYRTARAKLGKTATDEAEQRLHHWAGTYQEAGWPADTPDYLLYTYPVLLTRTGEQHRLSDLVLDPRRQAALVHRSSADAALSQLEPARREIVHSGAPDLGTLAALAASREMLTEGARALPPSLAEALARLGHADRAIEVARATAFPAEKARRLATLAGVLAETGHPYALRVAQEAAAWAAQARTEAESGDEYDAEVATGEAAVALVQAGQDEGLDLLATLRPPSWSGDETLPCVMLARAALAIRPRSADRAEALLDQAENSVDRIEAPADPASLVTAWAAIADAASPARAARAYARILEHVDTFPPGLTGAYVRASAASALADGRPEAAAELAGQAAQQVTEAMAAPEPPTGKRPDQWDLENALLASVRALVNLGAVEQATSLIESIPEALRRSVRGEDIRVAALTLLEAPRTAEEAAQQAATLALQGQGEEAERQLAEAIDTAPLYVASPREAHVEFLARALALTGQFADAEALAAGMADGPRQVRAWAALALQAAAAGCLPEANRLAHQAADRSRDLPGAGNFSLLAGAPGSRVAAAQASAAQALARAGDRDAALALAEEIAQVNASAGSQAFIAVAAGLRFHDAATAVRLVDRERERLTSNPKQSNAHVYELVELLTAIAGADEPCTARIEQAIDDACAASGIAALEPEDKLVISVLEARNQRENALALLARAERSLTAAPPGYMEPGAFAVGYAVFGDYDAARRAALDNPAPLGKAIALAAVADYLTGNEPGHRSTSQSANDALGQTLRSLALLVAPPDADGMPETAADLVREALADDGWYHALPALARIAPEAVERVRDVVFAHRQLPSTLRTADVPST
ncbi:hypothetical protein AB0C76_15520 [Kitasatospora sp. NPDC048722]|uniref:hypothetical protein n=1 Tax=Kitasatospora sp. NPDC048722 TaxID=3155639 RepID=UPI00340AE35A